MNQRRYFGIEGAALSWFKSHLAQRAQYVLDNGTLSPLREIVTDGCFTGTNTDPRDTES